MRLGLGMRWAFAAAWIMPGAVHAAAPEPALGCEQIFGIVQDAARYRNQGLTLAQVLSGLKEIEAKHALAPLEADALRQAVTLVYMRDAAPEEIALECVKSRKKK